MKTSLFLLRHGATSLNLEIPYRLQGNEHDEPLDAIGQAQAAGARDLLRSVPLSAFYSSPLKRAMQTAEIVAAPHALTVVPIEKLVEGSVGTWSNRTWDEIKVSEPEAYKLFMENPAIHGYAGGENFTQVLERVRPVFYELLRKHEGQAIAVMGHQIVNRVIVTDLLGLELSHARKLKFANAGVSLINIEDNKPHLVSLNISWPAMVMPN
jgi:broad specificity phosphatase PhoE